MQIAAIIKARTVAFIEIDELNAKGRLRLSELVTPLVEHYEFTTFPERKEDYDLSDKGVEFTLGRSGDIVIDTLKIFEGAIYVETLSSTSDSQTVLLEMLEWGATNLGLTYEDGMIRKWAYVSNLLFYSEFPILRAMSDPLTKLAQKTSRFMEDLWGGLKYEPLSFSIGHDPTARKHGIASFTIQHRVNSQLHENKYLSEAPVPTDLHIQLLEEFEKDILEHQRT